MPELEWFKRLNEIPGISWEPPVEVEVDPTWAAASPMVETYRDADHPFTIVSWRDAQGNPLADEFTFGSPAEAAGRAIREGGGTLEVLTALSRSLAVPGTRRDYFEAIEQATSVLSRIDDEDPGRPAWIESLAWLAVSLLRTGVEETLMPAGTGFAQRDSYIASAGMSYGTLIRLYLREGFLHEAAAVYEELKQLPDEARRWSRDLDPNGVMGALRELQDVVEVRE